MGRVADFLKRKAASALAERLVPWPINSAVAVLPERARLGGVVMFYGALIGGGVLYRWSRGEPLLGAGEGKAAAD